MSAGRNRLLSTVRTVLIATAGLFVLMGCSPSLDTPDDDPVVSTTDATASTSTSGTGSGGPTRGGEAVVGGIDEPATLNSFLPGGGSLMASVIGQAYAAGVQEISGFTLELIPELVTDLPTVDNGGVVLNDDGTMTVTYAIRQEAVWDDGTPISGADFQFTLETILDPALPISKTNYEDILKTIVGPKAFEYTMATPTIRYELMFSEIIPKHAVEGSDFAADWNIVRWPSAGPFVFDSWVTGESITVVRNERYWKLDDATGVQLPYLDGITFRFFEDSDSVIDSFEKREVDVINPDPTSRAIERLRSLEPAGAAVEVLSGPFWEHVNFQFGPGRLERNATSCNDLPEMRLAIAETIDRRSLVDDLFGDLVVPLPSYVDAFIPAVSRAAWDRYEVDHSAASLHYREAVRIAGVECSVVFSTSSDNEARVAMADLLVDMFAASGIPFEVRLEERSELLGRTMQAGIWDVGEWAWTGSPGMSGLVGIHDLFDPAGVPPDGSNFYRWGTADSAVNDATTVRFAEVKDAMNRTLDEDLLIALINEAEAILADGLVFIPLYSRPVIGAVWADEIGGYKLNPSRAGHTWNMEVWYRSDR